MIKGLKKENYISIAIMFVIGLMVFYYNKLTPLYADDYSYMYSFVDREERITSIFDIFPSMYSHYFKMNGRLVVHFIAQLLLLLGKNTVNILNSLAFVGLGLIIYALSYNSVKKIKCLPLLFIYFSLFMFTPDFGQSFLWVTGAANYLYGPIIALLFLIPFRKNYNKTNDNKTNIFGCFSLILLMFLFGIIAGNTNENNGVTIVFISVLYIIYRIVKFKNVQPWAVSGMLGSLFGCILMLKSPGTKLRLGDSKLSVLGTIKNAVINSGMLVSKFGILLIVLAILIFVYLYSQNIDNHCTKLKYVQKLLFYNPLILGSVLAFAVNYYSLSVSPRIPDRTLSSCLAFLIICILTTYAQCENVKIKQSHLNVLAISLAAVLLGTSFYGITELKPVNAAYQKRVYTINKSIENKETTVTLPAITSTSRYSCFDCKGDLTDDENSWQNRVIANYYNLDKVYLDTK